MEQHGRWGWDGPTHSSALPYLVCLKLNCKNPRVSAPSTQGTYRTNRAVHWILNCKEVKCQEAKIQKFASQEAEVRKRTRDCYSEI